MASLFERFHPNPAFGYQLLRVIAEGADVFECWRVAARVETIADWQREWAAAGARWLAQAEAAAARGDGYTARTRAFQAHFFYRLAEFFLHENTPEKQDLFRRMRASFQLAGRYFQPPLEPVRIPFAGTYLDGYFLPARGAERERRPAVVFIGGADSVMEECALSGGEAFRGAGLHTLVLDGPGQGAPLRFENQYARPDYEVVYSAALDYLAGRPECAPDRLGVVGVSMGGYYGARGALDPRVKAAVVWSALYDVGEGLYDYFPPIRDTLRYITGSRTLEETREKLRAFTLAPVVQRIRCPTLVVHGGLDHLVPESEARRIYEALTCEKALRIWPAGQHALLDYTPEVLQVMNAWLLTHLMR